MKIIKIIVDTIPKSCLDCDFRLCDLSETANRERILKKYHTKRHENCPLELEEK
jgi:hypothetical protein